MDADTTLLDCPAYLNAGGTVRCGLPAAVEDRYTLGSTDGAVPAVRIRCPNGHWFSGPVDALAVSFAAPAPDAGAGAAAVRAAQA
jgi:hypothetical protein